MSRESFAQQIDTVRQRPEVFSQLAEQASQKTLTQNLHELFTAIEHFSDTLPSTQKKKGMGLGLSACKRMMISQGGTVEVENTSGKVPPFILGFLHGVQYDGHPQASRAHSCS